MVARRRGRYLAPLALVVIIVVVVLVVRAGLHSKSNPGATPVTQLATSATTKTKPAAPPPVYIVKPGDSLSTIAVKIKVSVGQLEALNPGINPNVLQSGQRLKLR